MNDDRAVKTRTNGTIDIRTRFAPLTHAHD